MAYYKVEGHTSLVRDSGTNAIINSSKSDYSLYMKRAKKREKEGDTIKHLCREINNLKEDFKEIKEILKGLKK